MLWYFFLPSFSPGRFHGGYFRLAALPGGRFKAHLWPLPSVMTWQREEEEMQGVFFSISVCRDVADFV